MTCTKTSGTPVDTVNSYISTLTAENLIKRIQIGKYIRGGIITLIIILAVIASIFGITSYRSFQVFKQEAIYFTTRILNKEKSLYETKIILCLTSALFLLCSTPVSAKANIITDTYPNTPYKQS